MRSSNSAPAEIPIDDPETLRTEIPDDVSADRPSSKDGGITLLDLFAGFALVGMLTRPGSYDPKAPWKIAQQVLNERPEG